MTNPIPIRGEPLRYRFPSRTEGDSEHIVDLTELNGNAVCSCEDFTFRRRPEYRKNGGNIVHWERNAKGKIIKEATQCHHIHLCLLHLATSVAQEHGEQHRPAPVTVKTDEEEGGFGKMPF